MEFIMDGLKLADIKQESLHKRLDQLHAQASSVLSFTLEWKDLECHFESTKACLLRKAEEIDLLEKENKEMLKLVEEREKEVEIKLKRWEECSVEIQNEEKHLGLVKNWIQECKSELNSKEKQLNLVRQEVEDCNVKLSVKKEELRLVQNEIELKEKDLGSVEKLLEEHSKDILRKDEQLRSVQKLVEERSKELEFHNKEVERVKKLMANCDRDFELKQKELQKVRTLINGCNVDLLSKEGQLKMLELRNSAEFDSKNSKLVGIQKSIQDCSEDLDLKRKELDGIEKLIEARQKELALKEAELCQVQKLIAESSKDYDSKRQRLASIRLMIDEYSEELEAKEKQHDAINKSINVCCAELKSKETELELIEKSLKEHSEKICEKERKLDSVRKNVKHCATELESKEKELDKIKETVRTYYKDLELREQEFNTIQMSIEDRSEELGGKEKQLKSVQISLRECEKELKEMKEQQISNQKSTEECRKELESKKKDLDFTRLSLGECFDELQSKRAQLDSIQRASDEFQKEFADKVKDCDSMKKTLDEQLDNLVVKERQFEERVKEFELKEQQVYSMQKSVEQHCKEMELKEKQLSDILNAQVLLNEHLYLVHSEASTAIQKPADPAELVLDAMQWFYPLGLKEDNVGLSVVRRICITLLEQLLKICPQIKPYVKEEAMKLASEWKSKLRLSENSLEVLGFLQLLATFKLAPSFNAGELRSLLDAVCHHRMATELQKALGILDSLPGSNILSSNVRIEQSEHLKDPVHCSSLSSQSSATTNERSSALVNECSSKDYLMQNEVSDLESSANLAKFGLDAICGSFYEHWKNGDIAFDSNDIWNNVLLLEQLLEASPEISPQVKEDATKLAIHWEEKIRWKTQSSVEVLPFLLFLAVYGLVSYFGSDQIFRLIGTVAHHKQAPKICQALGFSSKASDVIQNLIKKKELMAAARFTFAFNLVNKFPPELILQEHLKNVMMDVSVSKNVKDSNGPQCKAIDEEVAALRSILELLIEYNYQSQLLTKGIIDLISELEKKKTAWPQSLQAPAPTNQPQQPQGRKHHTSGFSGPRAQTAFVPIVLPQLQNPISGNQLHPRINESVGRPAVRDLPTFASIMQPHQHNDNFGDQLHRQDNNKRPRIDVSVDRSQVTPGVAAYRDPVVSGTTIYFGSSQVNAQRSNMQYPFFWQQR